MTENIDESMKNIFKGSWLSKLLFYASWFFLICLFLSFFNRSYDIDPVDGTIISSRWAWEITIACAIAWLSTSYLSYRFAGGRSNPIVLEDIGLDEISTKNVPSYLFWAILSIFGFIPFGIIAVYYASQVISFNRSEDYSRAVVASKKTKRWCLFSFIVALVFVVLSVIF